MAQPGRSNARRQALQELGTRRKRRAKAIAETARSCTVPLTNTVALHAVSSATGLAVNAVIISVCPPLSESGTRPIRYIATTLLVIPLRRAPVPVPAWRVSLKVKSCVRDASPATQSSRNI